MAIKALTIDAGTLGQQQGRRQTPVSRATSQQAFSIYWPSVVISVVTLVLVWLGARSFAGLSAIWRAVQNEQTTLIGPIVLGFVAVVVVAEQLWPAVRRPLRSRGQVLDGLYLVVYAAVVVPFVVVIGVGGVTVLRSVAPWLRLPALGAPTWTLIVAGLVAMDATNWIAHWANHRFSWLWRLHAVHHTQEDLSILTSFRAHPLVHTSFLISTVPVFLLSSNAGIPLRVITIYVCMSSLPHANLNWSFGWVGRVVVSPAYHRLHHADRGRIDLNMGTVLTLWDVLARRAVAPSSRAQPIATGLAGRTVPTEFRAGRPRYLFTLCQQMIEPFTVVEANSRLDRSGRGAGATP